MARIDRLKVFLSWSGDTSRQVAAALRDWLPEVIQALDPWMSDVDIPKGSRWSQQLAAELASTHFGLVCATADNQRSPWMLFEAGALSRSVSGGDVATVMINIDPTDVVDPLGQFQLTMLSHRDMLKLLDTMNRKLASPLPDERLLKAFQLRWDEFVDAIDPALVRDTSDSLPQYDLMSEIMHAFEGFGDGQAPADSWWVHEAVLAAKTPPINALLELQVLSRGAEQLSASEIECPVHNKRLRLEVGTGGEVIPLRVRGCCRLALLQLYARIRSAMPKPA
jgi:hypothetical protein